MELMDEVDPRSGRPLSLETVAPEPAAASSHAAQQGGLSLMEVLDRIVQDLHSTKGGGKDLHLSQRQAVCDALGQLDLSLGELDRYFFLDPGKKYTRNLIATDNQTFTLLLLCWNPGMESPVHDHPCQGCWMRVVQGEIVEHRYAVDAAADSLRETAVNRANVGDVLFIHDALGYHKVANRSSRPAATLHLYSPPFSSCRVWLDTQRASNFLRPVTTYHSEHGVPISYELAAGGGTSTICDASFNASLMKAAAGGGAVASEEDEGMPSARPATMSSGSIGFQA